MAQEWTDGRLDDLSTRVDRGFEQVDQRFEQVDQRFERVEKEIGNLRVETRTEFTALRGEMKEGFARIDQRLDSIQRTMVQGVIAMAGATLAGFSGIIVLIATQL
jgi:hypothetical protein